MAITGTVPEPRPPSSFGASSNRCADVRLGNRSQLQSDRDCLILARLTRFTCLLDFRDSYGLLDHLTVSTTGATGGFTFRAAFFTGARLDLALAAVRSAALGTLRALPRTVAAFLFCAFDCFLRLAMIRPVLVSGPQCIDARSLSPGNLSNDLSTDRRLRATCPPCVTGGPS